MESTRVFLRGLNARVAIERYDGPLYYALFPRALKYMCKWETGEKEDFETMEQWLLMNNIAVEDNGVFYPKVPLLTTDLAKEFQNRIATELNDDFGGLQYIKQIKKKFDNWDDIGHNFVSQIILGVLWFNAWVKSSSNPEEPAALVITDLDLSPIFINGIVPLKGNEIISYWQTNQLGHPDTLSDIFKDKVVMKSLETINEDYTFTAYENALVLLNRLKVYKTKTSEVNMPVPYITMPKITLENVEDCNSELLGLAKHFISRIDKLDQIAKEYYENRPAILKKVDYHNYRNMIFLVYKYCVIDEYMKNDIFVEGKVAKDTKKVKSSPQWTML